MENTKISLIEAILTHSSEYSEADLIEKSSAQLKKIELAILSYRKSSRFRIALFCPTSAFEGNFGNIPEELERLNVEVHWLYGHYQAFQQSKRINKWLIIDDMSQQIFGIDAVITTSMVDCLPKSCLHILHDHLSFAHFDMELKVQDLLQNPCNLEQEQNWKNKKYGSKEQIFTEVSAFIAFLPFYDLILTSSNPITDLTKSALEITGYECTLEANPTIRLERTKVVEMPGISEFVDISSYRDVVNIYQSGYCKLDKAVNKYRSTPREKVIVYAPTPVDVSGNKESHLWELALTSSNFGGGMLPGLCEDFPDFEIVYKPFKDEPTEVVYKIADSLSGFHNFRVDYSGSNYWELYSRASVLISDFSSTAYSFAIGLVRPVIFFSPNEDQLPDKILKMNYCRHRSEIGSIARTAEEVSVKISEILENYDEYVAGVRNFLNSSVGPVGNASESAARQIFDFLNCKTEGLKR